MSYHSWNSRRVTAIRGHQDAEGLAEVSYFLKKAKHNIQYAMYALENDKYAEANKILAEASSAIDEIRKLGNELSFKLDEASASIARKAAQEDEENV